jgi:hypothetical protein
MTGERHRLGGLRACARVHRRRYRDLDYLAALKLRSLQPLALAAAIVSGCARADQSPGAGMPSWSLGVCAGLRPSGAIDDRRRG